VAGSRDGWGFIADRLEERGPRDRWGGGFIGGGQLGLRLGGIVPRHRPARLVCSESTFLLRRRRRELGRPGFWSFDPLLLVPIPSEAPVLGEKTVPVFVFRPWFGPGLPPAPRLLRHACPVYRLGPRSEPGFVQEVSGIGPYPEPMPEAMGAAAKLLWKAARLARAAQTAQRSGLTRFLLIGSVGCLLTAQMVVAVPAALISQSLDRLSIRPTLNVAIAAFQAAQSCGFQRPTQIPLALFLIGQAYLATGAGNPVLSRGARPFGEYLNPLAAAEIPGYHPLAGAEGIHIEPGLLRRGGEVSQMLGLDQDRSPAQWTTLGPWTSLQDQHGIGFLLIRPRDWLAWSLGAGRLAAVRDLAQRRQLDPYRPQDAFTVVACHLHDLVDNALAKLQRLPFAEALAKALTAFGDGVQQVWIEAQRGVESIREALAQHDFASLAHEIAAAEFNAPGQVYYSLLSAFVNASSAVADDPGGPDWPAFPAPLPFLPSARAAPLPGGLWSPRVADTGFRNPFPDNSQCTWWAYQAYAAFDRGRLTGITGDGGDWIAEAVRLPSLRSQLLTPAMSQFGPREGAVISLAKSPAMPYGHVALVREIATDSEGGLWMLLWDANWDSRGGRLQHWESWRRWQGHVAGFILPRAG
jgi:CHAP domain